MKLAYIENVRLPTEKAHGYQIMKTCEAMANAGASVVLIHAKRANPMKAREPFAHYGIPQSFALRALPVIDFLHNVPSWLWKFAYVLERWSFLRSLKHDASELRSADVWYTRDTAVAEVLRKIDARKPVFLELHDDPRSNTERWNRVKTQMSGFIVIGSALRELLTKEGIAPELITLAPDGFDPAQFANLPSKEHARAELGVDPSVFLALYAGHLYPWKGVDGIAPALDHIPEGCEFVIVGGNPDDLARIKQLVPPGATRVRFTGHVPQVQAIEWMSAADVAVLPTSAKFEIGRLYTSPLKLFEYLACGLPVLASDVPSSHEILDQSVARFFTPDDGNSFVEELGHMQQMNAQTRTQMSYVARTRVASYTWTERGKQVVEFVKSKVA